MHTVLIVDDEVNILMGLKRSLRKEPYRLLTAQSGKDALDLLKTDPVDVVVSDHDMPFMNGTELLYKIHKKYPDTIRFMLTGKATLEVAIKAINEGAISRFFTKPCNDVDLSVTIRQALQQKDLMAKAKILLKEYRHQNNILKSLENEAPGITYVKRDSDGAIIIDEDDILDDYDKLLDEINKEFEK